MISLIFIGIANAQSIDYKDFQLSEETSDNNKFANYDLTGTWTLTITPDDGETPPFKGYYTFNADGTASFSSAGPPIPALGNPGYGVWKRIAGNRFASTVMQNSYTTDFQFDGTLKINAKIRMTSRNTFITEDTVKIYDVDGNEIVTLGGSALGRRMFVED